MGSYGKSISYGLELLVNQQDIVGLSVFDGIVQLVVFL